MKPFHRRMPLGLLSTLLHLFCAAVGEHTWGLPSVSSASRNASVAKHNTSIAATPCDDGDFTKIFDLVITWHAEKPQSLLQLRGSNSSGRRFENQREVMYLLRGAEKYGLLGFVRKVFVVANAQEIDTFGPPRDLDWQARGLHLVRDTDIGVAPSANSYLSKVASFHRIPGISEWFLHLMDDVIPTKPFRVDAVYDFANHRPYVYMHLDTYIMGWCDGGAGHLMHGPWFASKCRLAELERKYQDKFAYVRQQKFSRGNADARCLYANWAASEGWSTKTSDRSFCAICHTNGGCDPSTFIHPAAMFTNMQGGGVSDEYAFNAHFASEVDRFFHETFPLPSRFEKNTSTRGI